MSDLSPVPRTERVHLPAEQRESLTSAILARTSGSSCERAAAMIAGRPERMPAGTAAALLASHLEHCAACRALEQTLDEARAALASMVEMAPAPGFAADVFRRTSAKRKWSTSGRRLATASLWELTAGWRDRGAAAWQKALARPRLSLELAYLATVLVVLVVGNPALIAEKLGARTAAVPPSAMTGQAAATAGGGIRTAAPGDGSRAEPLPGPNAVARGWEWLSSRVREWLPLHVWEWLSLRVSTIVDASWNWLADLVRWLDEHISGPPPTEPAATAVRDRD